MSFEALLLYFKRSIYCCEENGDHTSHICESSPCAYIRQGVTAENLEKVVLLVRLTTVYADTEHLPYKYI